MELNGQQSIPIVDWRPQGLKQVAEGGFRVPVWIPECPSGLVLSPGFCPLAHFPAKSRQSCRCPPSPLPPTSRQENYLQLKAQRGALAFCWGVGLQMAGRGKPGAGNRCRIRHVRQSGGPLTLGLPKPLAVSLHARMPHVTGF